MGSRPAIATGPEPPPRGGEAATGERKQVTVLFADIVGSTSMIRDLDPEDSVDLLDPVVIGMAVAVQAEAGTVLRFQGDGLKAIFGAPLAQEDHAERACLAALRIRDFARKRRVAIRIGVNSGEVVVRSFTLGSGTIYDAGGMPVHLAARLEQLAAVGQICISASTASIVRPWFLVRDLGTRQVKGLTEAVEVFEVVGRRLARSRWEARASKRVGKMVDRSSELDNLLDVLQATKSGKGSTVAIVGEPGIGKSRLIYELLNAKAMAGWTVVTASTEGTDTNSGLRPFAKMLRRWLGIGDAISPMRIWHELQGRFAALEGFNQHDVQALAAMLDLSVNVTTESAFTVDRRRSIFDAVIKLVRHWAAQGLTLLIFEDVHWLDRDSEELLRAILLEVRGLPIAVVITYRSGYPDDRFADAVQVTLELRPLSDADARQILDLKLGAHESLAWIKQQVVGRAGGTPFFVEEIARGLVENHTVVRSGGRYQAAQQAPTLSLPSTVRSLLADRLDRLSARHKQIVQLASVIGQEAPLPLLAHLLSCTSVELELELRPLWPTGMLVPMDSSGDRRVRFNHALTQEAAYAGLLKETRRTLHERVLRAYEHLYQDRLDENVEILVHHAREAALRPVVINYLTRAAQKAIRLSHHSRAIELLREALAALSEAGVGDDTIELELRLLLRVALNATGTFRERLPNLDRAQFLAEKLGNATAITEIMIARASVLLQLGKASEALGICAAIHRAAGRQNDVGANIAAGYMFSRSLFYNGHVRKALATASTTLKLLEASQTTYRHAGGFGSTKVMLLTQIAQAHACLGNSPDAVVSSEQALRIALDGRRDWDIELASFGLGIAHMYAGDLETVVPELECALRIGESEESASSALGMLTSLLGYASLRSGRRQLGLDLCRRALDRQEESYHHRNWTRLCCAAALREADCIEEATSLANKAQTAARRWNYPVQLAWSELLLAELLEGTRPGQAKKYLAQALLLSQTMHLRPFVARATALRSRMAQTNLLKAGAVSSRRKRGRGPPATRPGL